MIQIYPKSDWLEEGSLVMCDFHVGDSYLSFSKYAIGLEKYAMYITENGTSQNHFGITLQKKEILVRRNKNYIIFWQKKKMSFSALLNFYQNLRLKIHASQKGTQQTLCIFCLLASNFEALFSSLHEERDKNVMKIYNKEGHHF